MNNSKKILIIALAVILLLGATPAFAELDGTWAGEGEGWCYTPDGNIIYPWQTWIGEVAEGAFKGDWTDSDGNQGTFDGDIICFYTTDPPSYTFAHCEGIWTWASPDGAIPIEMGTFNMEFNVDLETCEGNWTTPDAAVLGTMWGERIGD